MLKGLACYIKDQRPVAKDRLPSLASEDSFADTDADFELLINAAVDLAFGYFLELGVLDRNPSTTTLSASTPEKPATTASATWWKTCQSGNAK